jgi:predicted anti-sigma-YlaC factor YlaD
MSREEIDCKRLWEFLSDYIDGDLNDELCHKIEEHMACCEDCRVVVDTTHKTIRLCHCDADDVDIPNDVRGRLFEILHIEDYLKPKGNETG